MPSELSGGQQKRIGIARMLIMKPEVILYDEPTAGLDPLTSYEINDLINEVQKRYKTSSVIITHDLTCAKKTGDRLLMLIDGKFLRQGDFDEVFDTDDERVKGLSGQRKTFQKTIALNAVFNDVGGLQKGNNIWFSGVKVGTVKKLKLLSQTQVEVEMRIEKHSEDFIRKDSKAKIGSDGLIG